MERKGALMKKLRIVVDCDGVLNEFWNTYCKKFPNANWETDMMKRPEVADFWLNPQYEFWYSLPELADSETFNRIMEGHEVIFLTNTAHSKARKDWLECKGYLTKDRTLLCNAPGTSKYNALKALKPDVFIDDFGKNIADGWEAGVPLCIKFENDKPYEMWEKINEVIKSYEKRLYK